MKIKELGTDILIMGENSNQEDGYIAIDIAVKSLQY